MPDEYDPRYIPGPFNGMTLLDWYAGQALIALIPAVVENASPSLGRHAAEYAAEVSFLFADAMIEERARLRKSDASNNENKG